MTDKGSFPILAVDSLTHLFDNGQAGVNDLTFSVAAGEFLVLAGSNGSGKTTLLRLLMGLLKPMSGRIRLKGTHIFKDLVATRRIMGLVFQDADTQILGETVYSEIAFGPENLGLAPEEIRTRVKRIMEDMQLSEFKDRHPATLSGGEKRRLTIAGILAMGPEIILFDEPFANLDYPCACSLARQIRTLHKAGKTIVMATHDIDHVLALADRILVMDKGRIRAEGKVRDMAERLGEFGMRPWCPACHPLKGE